MRYNTQGIRVTNVCNLTCDHCITDSSPHARGDLEWSRIEGAIRSAAPYVDGVCVTGGEPLLRRETTMRVIRLTRALGLGRSIVTNGYWARDGSEAARVFSELEDAGLDRLAVSFDRFHDRLVSSSSLNTLLATGADTSIEIQLQYCGDRQDDAYRGSRALFDRLSQQTRDRVADRVINHSICALCRAITDDDAAVGELRDALEHDRSAWGEQRGGGPRADCGAAGTGRSPGCRHAAVGEVTPDERHRAAVALRRRGEAIRRGGTLRCGDS